MRRYWGMTHETAGERAAREALEALAGRLVSNDAFEAARAATQARHRSLQQEIDIQRMLSKYARRTWFEVMYWVALFSVHLRDLAAAYDGVWFAPIFFLTSHGGPPLLEIPLRVLGGTAQLVLLYWLGRRSQVPDWLLSRVPHSSMEIEDYEKKYGVTIERPDRRPKWRRKPE